MVPHQQPSYYATFHIQRISWHLVNVGCIDHIGVQNQCIASLGNQPCGRRSITRMATISAPMPVGIKNTTLNRLVFSYLRRAKSNIEICAASPSSGDASRLLIAQLTRLASDFVMANLRGTISAGNRNRMASRICVSAFRLSSATGRSSSNSLNSNSFSPCQLLQCAFNKSLVAG